jgi:hypothetical protein
MLLALAATAIVIMALLWDVGWPAARELIDGHRARPTSTPAASAAPSSARASCCARA